jgi:predicted PurR-regulated permease PerM
MLISTTISSRTFFWAALAALFLGFLWLFSGILTPFVLGMTIAYLLDPVVSKMERRKMHRGTSALLILTVFFLTAALLLMLVGPTIYREARDLAMAAPDIFNRLWDLAEPHLSWLKENLGQRNADGVKAALLTNADKALNVSGGIAAGAIVGGKALVGFIGTLVITPLVAFFMMKEWPRITAWFDNLLPRGSRHTIRGLLHKIDRKMAGFVRGQISVALALAALYSIGLLITGVNYGFLIGIAAGLLYIVPYLGTAFGLVAAFSSALFQGLTMALAIKIVAVFVIGQIVETYFLTPRLVGGSVGMHPLWILFAVMAGGSMFGLTGMLLAVPVAAIIGVLTGFAIGRYKESDFYKTNPEPPPA